jgi:hypothetical protein
MKLYEIRVVGAELFQTDERAEGQPDRRTDMTKLIVAFRNFANGPKNWNCDRFFSGINILLFLLCQLTFSPALQSVSSASSGRCGRPSNDCSTNGVQSAPAARYGNCPTDIRERHTASWLEVFYRKDGGSIFFFEILVNIYDTEGRNIPRDCIYRDRHPNLTFRRSILIEMQNLTEVPCS